MVPFVILILFKFVATENLTDLIPVKENLLPNRWYNSRNAYNYKPTLNNQGYGNGYQTNGYPYDIPTKDSGQYYTSDDATPYEAQPIPVKNDNLNRNDNPSDNQGFNYPYQNNGIMAGTGQGQSYTDIQQDAVIPKDTNNQAMQSTPNQDRETNFTNTLLIIIGAIALLPTFILAGFMLRKRICVRQPVEDTRRQEEAQYEELNYRSVINIANRPPYPLPMPQEQIYTHYNSPYDHRIIPPPPRSRVH